MNKDCIIKNYKINKTDNTGELVLNYDLQRYSQNVVHYIIKDNKEIIVWCRNSKGAPYFVRCDLIEDVKNDVQNLEMLILLLSHRVLQIKEYNRIFKLKAKLYEPKSSIVNMYRDPDKYPYHSSILKQYYGDSKLINRQINDGYKYIQIANENIEYLKSIVKFNFE